MTLSQAVAAVPQLGSSCSLILTDGAPGSGIKLLRLVSKQLRAATLGVVRGYTLNLNGTCAGLMDEMTVLQGSKLSRLRVVVASNIVGGSPAGLNGWDAHTLHLRCFITGMGHAIRGITRLEVDANSIGEGSAEELAALLSQLASACPALHQLQLAGDIGRGFLAALGTACSKLWCLEVMAGVSSEILQQLHLVIPGLTHCSLAAGVMTGNFLAVTRPCCLALLSCTSLTSLDVGLSTLTHAMWLALPAGLKELRCSFGENLLPSSVMRFASLEHLCCECNPRGNHTHMRSLITALRAAPELKRLTVLGHGTATDRYSPMSEVYLCCALHTMPDLVYLNDRVLSGLQVTCTHCVGRKRFQGLNLSLSLYADADVEVEEEFEDMASYLTALPPLPAFTGLRLSTDYTQPSFKTLAKAIAAVFPNLEALALDLVAGSIISTDLQHLGLFTALHHLSLAEAHVSPSALALLCTRMPLLEGLRLKKCTGLSIEEGVSLQSALSDWGSASTVVILPLDQTDNGLML